MVDLSYTFRDNFSDHIPEFCRSPTLSYTLLQLAIVDSAWGILLRSLKCFLTMMPEPVSFLRLSNLLPIVSDFFKKNLPLHCKFTCFPGGHRWCEGLQHRGNKPCDKKILEQWGLVGMVSHSADWVTFDQSLLISLI